MAFHDDDRLLRHSLLLLGASQLGNLAAILYQVFLMRRLPPAEYGIWATLLGMIVIASIPLEALRTAMAHYAARYCQAGGHGRVRGLAAGWGKIIAVAALAVLVLAAAGRGWLADFFRLPAPGILLMAGAVMAGTLFMPLLAGALQGVQAFGWWALSGQSWGVVRLAAGAGLVLWVQTSAMMALLGQGLGVLACLAIGSVGLHLALRGKPDAAPAETLTGGGSYFLKSLLILAGYAVLANADICIVKHYFSPEETGGFARAATIGRGIVFLAMPVAAAMFPKVVSEGGVSGGNRRVLWRALGFAAGLIAAACIGASLLAGPIWQLFVGRRAEAAELALLRMLLWAMAPIGLTFIMLNFELAQRRFRWAWAVVFCSAAYLAGAMAWHQTTARIVAVMACVNVLALVFLAIGMPWRESRTASGRVALGA